VVREDAAELERLGLLLPGDEDLVKGIRADRRPKVYDLAMSRSASGRAPSKASRGASRRAPSAKPRGASGASTRRIPRTHEAHLDAPRKDLNRSRTSSSARTTRTGSRRRAAATDDDFDSICDKLGATGPQREVIRSLAAAQPRGQFNGYLRAHLDRDGGEEFMSYIRRVTIEEDGAEQAATGQDDDGEEFPF
jgi:hypothetical protein